MTSRERTVRAGGWPLLISVYRASFCLGAGGGQRRVENAVPKPKIAPRRASTAPRRHQPGLRGGRGPRECRPRRADVRLDGVTGDVLRVRSAPRPCRLSWRSVQAAAAATFLTTLVGLAAEGDDVLGPSARPAVREAGGILLLKGVSLDACPPRDCSYRQGRRRGDRASERPGVQPSCLLDDACWNR